MKFLLAKVLIFTSLAAISQNALDFDGVSDFVRIPESGNSALDPSTTMTVEVWVRPDNFDAASQGIVSRYFTSGNSTNVFQLRIDPSNRFHFSVNQSNNTLRSVTADAGLSTSFQGEWVHLAGVADGTNLYLYVKGLEAGTISYDGTITSTSDRDIIIGKTREEDGFGPFQGRIDEVRIWDVARSQAEILQNLSVSLSSEVGLVAAYDFNSGVAGGTNTGVTTLTDITSNTFDGTLNGFALTGASSNWVASDVPQSVDYALDFDGSDDIVVTGGDQSVFDFTSNDAFTIEAWVRTSSPFSKILAAKRDDAGGGSYPGYVFWTSDNRISVIIEGTGGNRIYVQASNDGTNVISLSTNTWTHLAFSYDGSGAASGVRFFIDGVETLDNFVNTDNLSGSMQASNPFEIGRQSVLGSGWIGEIDDVRVWNTERAPEQIAAFYNEELNGSEPGLVGYWNLNEATGTTAADLAGSANNGTLTNMDPATDWEISGSGISGASALDATAPTVTVSSTESGTTSLTPFPVTFTFTEFVVNFDESDISVTNGSAANLNTVDNIVWTADITPSAEGTVDVDVITSSVNDLTGNALTSTTPFSITYEEPNYALDFDGTDDYVNIPVFDFSTGNTMTIEAWVRPDDITTNTHYQITRQDDASNLDWLLSFQNNGTILSFGLRAGGSYEELDVGITAANYTDGNWHHIAAVYDGVNKYLYSDGALIGTQAKTGNIAAMSTVNSIGSSRGTSEYFNGQIDEVRFWSTARYEDQILAFKDVELNGGEPGLEAYYNFSDGPGDNLVPDLASSGGVQNGILTNMDNATDYVVATHGVSDASALDVTAPSVTVSSTESGTTSLAPFPVTFTFTEFVVGFEVSDINAPAAIVSNLSTADNIVWTADITPPVEGAINVDVANGSVQDLTGNALSGSTAFDITFDAPENALTFDGLNDFVDISDVDKITNPALQDYTISMWFSSEDPSGGDFLLSYSHSLSGNEPFSSLTVNNTINFSRRNTAGGESLTLTGPEITANEWYL